MKPTFKLTLAAATAGLVSLGSSAGALAQSTDSRLSPEAQARADAQIATILKDKAARTPAQKKMDSQLIYAAREATTGKAVDGLPALHSSAKVGSDGRVEVDVKGKITAGLLAAIAAQGGKIVQSHPEADMVRVTLPLVNVEAIAARPEVRFIARPPKMIRHSGSVTAESDKTELAASARSTYGVTGAGISVGVISDSADDGKGTLAAAYASGDLDKNNTFIISGQAGTGSGEGGAMMQIVHDIAPGSKVYFASSGGSPEQFAANIRSLKAAGCKVIVDDITFGNESPFQDQVISQAVAEVISQGVLYFSSNGNGGNKEQNTATIWEGDFKDGGAVPGSYSEGSAARFHAFTTGSGSTKNNLLKGDGGGTLFWSDPLGASSNDYDLFEVDSSGTIVNSSTDTQDGTQDPFETFDGTKQGDSLQIVRATGVARFLHMEGGESSPLTITTTGNLRGHNGPATTTGMFSVSAAPCAASGGDGPDGPFPNAFNANNATESFSSDGPRRMFYKADGTAFTPGNVSSTGGKVFAHPDITGGDGVVTTSPDSGLNPFYGTSAAAPDAAAVAALLLSKYPNLTLAQADAAMRAGVVKNNQTAATAGAGIVLATKVLAAGATGAPVINSSLNAPGRQGVAFAYTITATNGATSFATQGLPSGLGLSKTTGRISGTPNTFGTYKVKLTATNSVGSGTATLNLVVKQAVPVITSATAATTQVGAAFSYLIAATNSPTSYGASGLPAGITINQTTGMITGKATKSGTYSVLLAAFNGGGYGTIHLNITVQ